MIDFEVLPILKEAKQCLVSYTFTDVPFGVSGGAGTTIGGLFKQLHFNVEPRSPGSAENSYDLVVSHLGLQATVSLQQTLGSITQLLETGGCLVVLELQKDLSVRWTAILGLHVYTGADSLATVRNGCVQVYHLVIVA